MTYILFIYIFSGGMQLEQIGFETKQLCDIGKAQLDMAFSVNNLYTKSVCLQVRNVPNSKNMYQDKRMPMR